MFQYSLAQTKADNPLRLATSSLLTQQTDAVSFIAQLQNDQNWRVFKAFQNGKTTQDDKPAQDDKPLRKRRSAFRHALERFLRELRVRSITRNALGRHLTRITAFSRSRKSHFIADASLRAPIKYQQLFVRYRMGRFM